jgi:hypothetical protein
MHVGENILRLGDHVLANARVVVETFVVVTEEVKLFCLLVNSVGSQ